ncbi:MAG: hypothetical protein FJ076_09760 [Cyanobacteria bacterium K_DeepCast_35m_m1_288]|nr:hypothetical protein [Cyanobacteria bacterium K_DeepCast_35m_m1_288]MBM5797195.1 hypothetical protein [Cyanobacteria bacterium K_Offshore_0m_m2_072]
MRFYAVCTEAIRHTHRALAQLDHRRRGSLQPARTMRVATLYGHLQCRARGTGEVQLLLGELAASWFLQPRLLREDLCDLQSLGWLRFRSGNRGTRITLLEPPLAGEDAAETPAEPLAEATDSALHPAPNTKPPRRQEQTHGGARPHPDDLTPLPNEPSEPEAELVQRFAELYNAHKPQGWPSYTPRGSGLGPRLRRAIQQVGEAEAFWGVMTQALAAMPEFWRNTYPRGRSGADCAAALFCADRSNSGLGPEFWHVFTWAAGASQGAAATAQAEPETDLQRADRLLLWDGHQWRGQGEEALYLPRSEKRRLAELLEAAGQGLPGAAAQQYAATPEA